MGTIGYINIDIKRASEEDSWYILRFTPWCVILKRRGNEHTKFKIAAMSRVKRKGCEKVWVALIALVTCFISTGL